MSTFVLLLFIILTMTALETIALICLQKYHNGKKIMFYVVAVIMYVIITLLIVYSLNHNQISIINSIWNALTIILVTVVSFIIFKEPLTKYQVIGIVLIAAGIIVSGIVAK